MYDSDVAGLYRDSPRAPAAFLNKTRACKELQHSNCQKSLQIKPPKTASFGPPVALYQGQKGWMIMTVLLVLATFLVFIVLDYLMNRQRGVATVAVDPARPTPVTSGREYVGGFLVPEGLSYHPGHSWLVRERKNVVRVGVDEFAVALMGKVEKINVPSPGQWLRQG